MDSFNRNLEDLADVWWRLTPLVFLVIKWVPRILVDGREYLLSWNDGSWKFRAWLRHNLRYSHLVTGLVPEKHGAFFVFHLHKLINSDLWKKLFFLLQIGNERGVLSWSQSMSHNWMGIGHLVRVWATLTIVVEASTETSLVRSHSLACPCTFFHC